MQELGEVGDTLNEELRVKLLGSPAAFVGDEQVTGFVSTKARALLYYLAATGEMHRRDALAALLWSDVPDATARKNLRDVLSNLRRLIGPFLIITRHKVGLNPDAPTNIDSQVFLGTLSAVRGMKTAAPVPGNTLESLAEVADPRKGEFLAGFYAPDAPLYEEWMLAERAHLQWELGQALEKLTEYSLIFEDYAEAEAYARRQLELDSYRERAHRQLMTVLALSDRRAEAVAHYDTLVDLLWSELGLEPAEKTQALIGKIQAGETITPTKAGIAQAPADNLPEALTPFIGREKDLASIATQLEVENCRLLTLHGPGGAGKTRLALEFARRQRGQYADGIFFVPLAGLASPANLETTIASAAGLKITSGREPRQQLLRFLQTRQMLLLLDNFEHLKEGAILLVDILQAAPRVTILVTSRDRLQLAAESLYEVYGLRTDSDNSRSSSPIQAQARTVPKGVPEAVQMFETYARRVQPEFQPDEEGSTAVADLCRLVEGMPLAIELAAAWVRDISPTEILTQITAGGKLLEVEYVDVPPRLRSIRASFNYSWGLMQSDEQQALMHLSVFRGGCSRASAEAVARAGPGVLAALIDKSMLTYDPADGRYALHELIRQLAAERLRASEQAEAVKNKHARHFRSTAWRAWNQAEKDRDWDTYWQQIDPDFSNFRIALERSLDTGDTNTALQLATALAEHMRDLGMGDEAIRLQEEALAAGGEHAPPAIRAAAYLRMSSLWWEARRNDKPSIELIQKGLEIYRQIGDHEGVARALIYCAAVYRGTDYDLARTYLIQAREAHENAGLDSKHILIMLGKLELAAGNLEEALSLITRGRDLYEKQASEYMLRVFDNDLAKIYYFQGRLDEAQTLAESSLQYWRARDPETMGLIPLQALIPITLAKGQLNHARDLLHEQLQIIANSNHISETIFCLDTVGEWLFLTSQPRQAAFWLGCFDRTREWANHPVEPVALPHYQWLVSGVCDALGEEVYRDTWEEGYDVSVDEMPALALAVVEQTIAYPGGC